MADLKLMNPFAILNSSAFALILLLSSAITHAADASSSTNDEPQLIAILKSGAALAEKDAACARLKRIGTEQCIPALAALLPDEQLSHSARYALESMTSPKAGAALVQALDITSGTTQLGVINSLAVRRETQAVPALAKLLGANDKTASALRDEQTQLAAAAALGDIASSTAIEALDASWKISSGQVRLGVVDALLRAAGRLVAGGDPAKALSISRRVYETETSYTVRMAAYTSMVRASGERALPLLTEAIAGGPGPNQTAALEMVRDTKVAGATEAFAKLLPKVSAVVQVSLIEGLAQRGDTTAAPAIAPLARSRVPEVRLAAIKALGWLGDDSSLMVLVEVAATQTGDEQTAARQALAQVHRGEPTRVLLQHLTDTNPAIQAEVARALGERRDAAALPKLLELARQGGPSSKAALQGLAALADEKQLPALIQLVVDAKDDNARGQAAETLNTVLQRAQANKKRPDLTPLVQALSSSPTQARVALLPVCSGLMDPQVREVLRSAAANSDTAVRGAGLRALCDTRDAELLPDVLRIAMEAPEENFRSLAVAGCVRLTSLEEGSKLSNAARIAPLKRLLGGKLSAPEKKLVLSGLAELPEPEALALAEPLLDEPAVQTEAARAVVKIAAALPGSADPSRAALKKVLASAADPGAKQAAQAALKEIDARSDFITTWQVAGPYRQAGKDYAGLFDLPFPPELGLGGATGAQPESTAGARTDPPAAWRPLPAGADPSRPGVMDLLKPLGGGEQCVCYVRTRIYSREAQAARLEIGSDDGVKVWLNGKVVHANNVARPLQIGSDKVNVNLSSGWNELLMKITQNNLGWEFTARVLQPDGSHLDGLQCQTAP